MRRFDAHGFEDRRQTHKNPEQPIKTMQINEIISAFAYLSLKNIINKTKLFNIILSVPKGC